jgi:hypothetical protein
MALEQYAFIERARMPSRAAWQSAITECGFDLELHAEMRPMKDSGFCPCTLLGELSGVEIYYTGDPEFLKAFSSIRGGRDFCVAFRWSSRDDEAACAMILSYALARYFGAVVSFEGEEPFTLEELLREAERALKSFKARL